MTEAERVGVLPYADGLVLNVQAEGEENEAEVSTPKFRAAEARRLVGAATPGPWSCIQSSRACEFLSTVWDSSEPRKEIARACSEVLAREHADAAFIAWCRNNIEAMAADIEGLTAALEPFARAFEREKYGRGVSARDWKRAYDAFASVKEGDSYAHRNRVPEARDHRSGNRRPDHVQARHYVDGEDAEQQCEEEPRTLACGDEVGRGVDVADRGAADQLVKELATKDALIAELEACIADRSVTKLVKP